MKKEYIIPIFVPHLGCPNQCTFCNQKKISGQLKKVTAKDVEETIEYYLKNFKDKNKYVEVAFFGGSFTAIDEKEQEELLNAAYKYIKNKKVNSIRISTRPDCINKEINVNFTIFSSFSFSFFNPSYTIFPPMKPSNIKAIQGINFSIIDNIACPIK